MDEKIQVAIEYNFRREIERARANRPTLKSLAVSVYKDDATFKQFRPGEPMTAAEYRREMIRLAAIAKADYGVEVNLVEIDAENYLKWLEGRNRPNTAATRALYVNAMLGNEMRGGKRKGQGRKAKTEGKRIPVNISLSPEALAKLDALRGKENRSEYIRRRLGL